MATGFPATTGDVLSAAMFNGLVAFTVTTESGATYTVDNDDLYHSNSCSGRQRNYYY